MSGRDLNGRFAKGNKFAADPNKPKRGKSELNKLMIDEMAKLGEQSQISPVTVLYKLMLSTDTTDDIKLKAASRLLTVVDKTEIEIQQPERQKSLAEIEYEIETLLSATGHKIVSQA